MRVHAQTKRGAQMAMNRDMYTMDNGAEKYRVRLEDGFVNVFAVHGRSSAQRNKPLWRTKADEVWVGSGYEDHPRELTNSLGNSVLVRHNNEY